MGIGVHFQHLVEGGECHLYHLLVGLAGGQSLLQQLAGELEDIHEFIVEAGKEFEQFVGYSRYDGQQHHLYAELGEEGGNAVQLYAEPDF